MDKLIEPTASMPYEGTKLATIHQSSAANAALLLHRAANRRHTATVARIPQATVTRMTRSRPGLTGSICVSAIELLLEETRINPLSEELVLVEKRQWEARPQGGCSENPKLGIMTQERRRGTQALKQPLVLRVQKYSTRCQGGDMHPRY